MLACRNPSNRVPICLGDTLKLCAYVSYTTLLLKQNFSSKAVSKLLGHAKEIITVDVYGDNANMLPDDIPELLEFIEEVMPDKKCGNQESNDLTDIEVDVSIYFQ